MRRQMQWRCQTLQYRRMPRIPAAPGVLELLEVEVGGAYHVLVCRCLPAFHQEPTASDVALPRVQPRPGALARTQMPKRDKHESQCIECWATDYGHSNSKQLCGVQALGAGARRKGGGLEAGPRSEYGPGLCLPGRAAAAVALKCNRRGRPWETAEDACGKQPDPRDALGLYTASEKSRNWSPAVYIKLTPQAQPCNLNSEGGTVVSPWITELLDHTVDVSARRCAHSCLYVIMLLKCPRVCSQLMTIYRESSRLTQRRGRAGCPGAQPAAATVSVVAFRVIGSLSAQRPAARASGCQYVRHRPAPASCQRLSGLAAPGAPAAAGRLCPGAAVSHIAVQLPIPGGWTPIEILHRPAAQPQRVLAT